MKGTHITLTGHAVEIETVNVEQVLVGDGETVAQRRHLLVKSFGRDNGLQIIAGRTMPAIDSDNV